jgi:hypothetical protein
VKFIATENVEALYEVLIDLAAGQSVCISASDFRKLTGDEITKFASEGRLMMGNLSARANCTIETTVCAARFTKNLARPVSDVWPSLKSDLSVRCSGSSSQ